MEKIDLIFMYVGMETEYELKLLLFKIKENNYQLNHNLKKELNDLIDGEYREKVENMIKYAKQKSEELRK